jgi:hypothetical protein
MNADTPRETAERRAKNIEINRLLVDHFPELASRYQDEVDSGLGEDEEPMIFYAEIFHPFLVNALRTEGNDSDLLERLFAFLTMLENHSDSDYSYTATIGIAEYLVHDPDVLERAIPRLPPQMKRAIESLQH